MSKQKGTEAVIVKKTHKVSKGQRASGGRVHRPAIKAVEGDHNSAILNAFLDAEFNDSIRFSRLGNLVIKAAQHEPKPSHAQAKGWSTNLSFRTFKALEAQGYI